jgi:hypothetical protein
MESFFSIQSANEIPTLACSVSLIAAAGRAIPCCAAILDYTTQATLNRRGKDLHIFPVEGHPTCRKKIFIYLG